MNFKLKYLKLYFLGFILAFLVNSLTTCTKSDSPTAPDDKPTYIETTEMKNLSDSLITAFKSENKSKVISCLNDEVKDIYSNELNNTTASLSAFSNALKNRKLIYATSLYAEYEMIFNGQTYSIAYANCGDGKWQLVRF